MTYEIRHNAVAPEDDDTYFMWLLEHVGADGAQWTDYTLLLLCLMDTVYIYDEKLANGREKNRALDGINLRREFAMECAGEVASVEGECTVLEMLVALACRIEYELASEDGEEDPVRWFELFLVNLDLLGFDDENFDEALVYAILSRWMHREYDRYGHGGLFPLKARRCPDQRKIETWYQMQAYIMETFPD